MAISILYTIPNFITAGSGSALLNVVRRLDRSRFDPSICVLKRGGNLEAQISELGIPLLELPFAIAPRPLHDLPLRLWHAARQFRPLGFALWHSYHYGDDYTEPLVARLSGARHWVYTKKNMGWGSRAWRLRTLLATRIAAQNSAMLARFFQTNLNKVCLLPRGVDAEQFKPGTPPRLGLRNRLRIGSDTILIGCVAHLLPVKGHPTLLHALARVPDVHLVLAGRPLDQPYVDALHTLARELNVVGRTHFLDNVQDIPALHAELDIFVLPTLGRMRMEGCPVALLEAMSSGLPCIATDIPGSQDVIERERSGVLVPPEDPTTLASALQRLVDSQAERARLGQAARQRILDHYTIEREVAAHEALYAELLGV